MNGSPLEKYGLPTPIREQESLSREILREMSYDTAGLSVFVDQNIPKLTNDQSKAYDSIIGLLSDGQGVI